ncbi:MAG: gliding motility-associated C-terminal domain-containing protein [Bacteroidota bacterium]|nr:gliding motility-associated C-terminal domain-containing protein [Bacteroidota bacterium]
MKANNPPANDSDAHAIDLGTMDAPGFCPNDTYGDSINVFGSTNFATYNVFEFSATHCFPSPSPDVWYKFRATGSYLYMEVTGSGGLNNFFVKLHHSQGSNLSLVPMDCFTSTGGILYAIFPTPVMNGEYYLQIGGSTTSETGDFLLAMKSYNECNSCVKQGDVELSPAPTMGRYNLGETVMMCATVSRWEVLSGSSLHSIVPEFGPDWDLTTLAPVSVPSTVSSSTNNYWQWMTNISTPTGLQSGFFFDGDGDGDPTNNPGDGGNVLSSWKGCWKINTKAQCLTNDISADVHLYSDAETGSSSATFICDPYSTIHISTSTSCCPAPYVSVVASSCSSGNGSVYVIGDLAAPADPYNYTLVDTGMNVLQSFSVVNGGVTFNGLFPGQYTIYAEHDINSCIGFQAITIQAGVTLSTAQSVISCTPGQGEAIVSVVNGIHYPYTYNWINVPVSNQNDSLAFNLPDGWVVVSVTDNVIGCTVMDSVFITSQATPDATFDYTNQVYCSNQDSVFVQVPPASPGGQFNLVSPLTAGINVDNATGTILLNNTTFATPFWVIVKYIVGGNCQDVFMDSVEVVAVPPAPVPTTNATQNYCIGGIVPVFSVSVPNGMFAFWYDAQTTGSAVGSTFTPPLNASSTPGIYYYLATTLFTLTGGCSSAPTFFVVNVTASPLITTSADVLICSGDTASLSVNGCPSCNVVWSPAPTIGPLTTQFTQTSPAATTTYTLVATDQLSGCFAMDFTIVNIDASSNCAGTDAVTFYTGITPNGDGHNDNWVIDGIDSLANTSVEIFNRWGKSIWRATDYDNLNSVWRGTDRNGNQLPDGTYYYVITFGDFSKTGWIELSH